MEESTPGFMQLWSVLLALISDLHLLFCFFFGINRVKQHSHQPKWKCILLFSSNSNFLNLS